MAVLESGCSSGGWQKVVEWPEEPAKLCNSFGRRTKATWACGLELMGRLTEIERLEGSFWDVELSSLWAIVNFSCKHHPRSGTSDKLKECFDWAYLQEHK